MYVMCCIDIGEIKTCIYSQNIISIIHGPSSITHVTILFCRYTFSVGLSIPRSDANIETHINIALCIQTKRFVSYTQLAVNHPIFAHAQLA